MLLLSYRIMENIARLLFSDRESGLGYSSTQCNRRRPSFSKSRWQSYTFITMRTVKSAWAHSQKLECIALVLPRDLYRISRNSFPTFTDHRVLHKVYNVMLFAFFCALSQCPKYKYRSPERIILTTTAAPPTTTTNIKKSKQQRSSRGKNKKWKPPEILVE